MQASDVTATTGATHAKGGRRMASIDGLRGLAALTVFTFHGWLYTMPTPAASNRSNVGDYIAHELRLGLVLFFVLSGYLLSRPWFAAALEERRPPDLRGYLRARLARIAPAYYAALIGSIGLLWGLNGTPGLRLPPAGELPLFFVFAQNTSPASVMKLNPPMWSLAVEVSFYAVLPALGWLAYRLPPRRRMQALIPLALLALGIAWNWSIAGKSLGMTFSKTLLAMLPYFAVGMLAALVLHGRTPSVATRRSMIAAGLALVDHRRRGQGVHPGRRHRVLADRARHPRPALGGGLRAAHRRRGGAADGPPARQPASSRAWARSPTASTCGTCRCSCSCAGTTCCHCTRSTARSSRSSRCSRSPRSAGSCSSARSSTGRRGATSARAHERRERAARLRRSGGGSVDRRAGGREVSTVRA